MNLQIIRPTRALSPYIRDYWYLEMEKEEAVLSPQRLIPTGFPEMIFHFEEPLLKQTGSVVTRQPRAMFCSMRAGFSEVVATGRLSMLAIRFFPHAPGLFLPFPTGEAKEQDLEVELCFGPEGSILLDRLQETHLPAMKAGILDEFLFRRLLLKKDLFPIQRISGSLSLIHKTQGRLGIPDLASATCLSRKQFEREFQSHFGLPPKQFLRIFRFQHTIYLKSKNPGFQLSELAFLTGYADLSHMSHEFKSLSGLCPSDFFSLCPPYSDYFE